MAKYWPNARCEDAMLIELAGFATGSVAVIAVSLLIVRHACWKAIAAAYDRRGGRDGNALIWPGH
jgi:hypothetical protein